VSTISLQTIFISQISNTAEPFRHATQTFLLEAVVRLTDVEEREARSRKLDLLPTIGRLLYSFHTAGVLAWCTPSWHRVAFWLRTRVFAQPGCDGASYKEKADCAHWWLTAEGYYAVSSKLFRNALIKNTTMKYRRVLLMLKDFSA
jgi:hypothetical protein